MRRPQNACIQCNVSINKPQMLSMYISEQIFNMMSERESVRTASPLHEADKAKVRVRFARW